MLQTTTGRIGATLLVSLAIHLLLLLGPWGVLPPAEPPELPPLTAQLVRLPPKAIPKPIAPAQPKPAPKPIATPTPPSDQPMVTPSEPIAPIESSVAATSAVEPVAASAIEPLPPVVIAEPIAPPAPTHPALPKHAQLYFLVYKGKDFQVGEAKHRLEISDDQHYTLKVGMSTTGIVSLFKIYDSEQISEGIVDAQGLRPDRFTENKRTGKGKESFAATFNWTEKQLSFTSGNTVTLPEHTQDLMSALYQVSQLDLSHGTITVPVTNGRKLERYEFAVGEEQDLPTRLGTLRALPLRKVHAAGEEGLEIWLGLEYRLLPIKFTQLDRAGQVAAEMIISEIRVKD